MIFQILSMVSFGVSNCFWEKPLKQIPILHLILIRSFFTTLCFALLTFLIEYEVIYIPLNHIVSYKNLIFYDVLNAIGLCFVGYWGLYFFLKSMKHTDGRISIVMATSGSLIFVLIGIYFYNEKPTIGSYMYMLIFALGWWFIEDLRKAALKFDWSKGVVYALLCMLFWRSGGFAPMAISHVGILYFSLIGEVTVFLITFFILLGSKLPQIKVLVKQCRDFYLNILFLVVFGFCGVLFFNIAIKGTELYHFALIGMLQPLTSVVLAGFIFKTKLSFYQTIGVGVLLIGLAIQLLGLL